MYVRSLRHTAHTRRFSIRPADTLGWEVRDERDEETSRRIYQDWHRVERAIAVFALEALRLKAGGWIEV